MSVYRFVGALVAGVCILGGSSAWIYLARRKTPRARERERRLMVGREGRLADGMIIDVRGNAIVYTYTIHGVGYMASQDISDFQEALSGSVELVGGPVMLKYARKDPANSVVLCEEWSGLSSRNV